MWKTFLDACDFADTKNSLNHKCKHSLAFSTKSFFSVLTPYILMTTRRIVNYDVFCAYSSSPTIGLTQKLHLWKATKDMIDNVTKLCPMIQIIDLERFVSCSNSILSLSKLHFLKNLCIWSNNITNDIVNNIADLTWIKELELCVYVESSFSCDDYIRKTFSNVSEELLANLFKSITRLISLKLFNFSNMNGSCLGSVNYMLRKLDLSVCHSLNDESLAMLCDRFCVLEELNLDLCKNLTDVGFQNLRYLSWTLQIFNASGTNIDTGLVGLSEMKFLRELDLSHCHKLSNQSLINLSGVSSLNILDISNCYTMTHDWIKYIVSLKNIKTLDVHCIDDIDMKFLGEMTSLHNLIIHDAYKISAVGIKYLQALSQLYCLKLYNCFTIELLIKEIGGITSLHTLECSARRNDCNRESFSHDCHIRDLDLNDKCFKSLSNCHHLKNEKVSFRRYCKEQMI